MLLSDLIRSVADTVIETASSLKTRTFERYPAILWRDFAAPSESQGVAKKFFASLRLSAVRESSVQDAAMTFGLIRYSGISSNETMTSFADFSNWHGGAAVYLLQFFQIQCFLFFMIQYYLFFLIHSVPPETWNEAPFINWYFYIDTMEWSIRTVFLRFHK